jgi:hypothetical protein
LLCQSADRLSCYTKDRRADTNQQIKNTFTDPNTSLPIRNVTRVVQAQIYLSGGSTIFTQNLPGWSFPTLSNSPERNTGGEHEPHRPRTELVLRFGRRSPDLRRRIRGASSQAC